MNITTVEYKVEFTVNARYHRHDNKLFFDSMASDLIDNGDSLTFVFSTNTLPSAAWVAECQRAMLKAVTELCVEVEEW